MNQIERGTGQKLLLVHGLGGSWRSWSTILDALSADRTVLAIDLPGHGVTPAGHDSGTFDGLVGSVERYITENDLAGIEENLRWIRDELSPKVAISLMAQYYATNKAATDERYILLSRRISEREWFSAIAHLEELGMEEGFMQEYESASHYYRPDFTDAKKPFKDIRDFQ